MLLFVLSVIVVALAVALGVLLRRAARLRAEAVGAEARLADVRARVEHASAALVRSVAAAAERDPADEPLPVEPAASESVPAERPPRERRRTRRSPSPPVRP